jgi:hypothetical protein
MKTAAKTKIENQDFELKTDSFLPIKKHLHIYNKHTICVTDSKGHARPDDKDELELQVDGPNGFISLWQKDITLNWRFSKSFGSYFTKPEAAKTAVKQLLGKGIMAWQDSCPVRFHEDNDLWDFEIDMHQEDCDENGCVLASAFFPDAGRHTLYIYPILFGQSETEQIETLAHEIGHIFGLRHFFAKIHETGRHSELFGADNEFSIMNYGDKSMMTETDIKDLKRLYEQAWSGQLTQINGTKIRLVAPYHLAPALLIVN